MYSLFLSQILFWTELHNFEMQLIEPPLLLDWYLVCIDRKPTCLCSWRSLAILSLVIAQSTLPTSFFYLLFTYNLFWVKLTLLRISSFSSFQLYLLFLATLPSLILTSIVLFLLLELGADEIHIEELRLPLGWVRAQVFVVCHSLAKASSYTVQDDVTEVVICHLDIDIESIHIVRYFWTVPMCLRSLILLKALSGL